MSDVITVKISKRNQIAVPSEVRRKLKLKSGDRVVIDIQGGMAVILAVPTSYTDSLAGLHREIWQDIDTDAYLQGERESWEKSAFLPAKHVSRNLSRKGAKTQRKMKPG